MNYSEFAIDAEKNYAMLPEEQSELYKKNFIHLPAEYLPTDFKAGSDNPDSARSSEDMIALLKKNLNLEFDICISDGHQSGSHKNARIASVLSLTEQEISSKLYKSAEEKFSAFANAATHRIIHINVKKGEKANLSVLFLSMESSLFTQVICNVEAGAELTLFEMCASKHSKEGSLGIVNEVRLGDEAKASIHLIHNEDDKTAVINLHKAELGKNSKLNQHHIYTGGAYIKAKGAVTLRGDSAESDMNEIILGSLEQKMDIMTEIVNFSKGSLALLESKAVLTDKSRCILKGFAHIKEGAVGSRSMVEEKGLLLDNTAKIDSIPGMSVDEYDVKATHASATSPVEEEAIFYLTSRGLDRITANRLLVDGFLGGSIGKIKDLRVRNAIASIINDKVINKNYGVVPVLTDENLLLTFHDESEEGDRIIQEHYKYRGA